MLAAGIRGSNPSQMWWTAVMKNEGIEWQLTPGKGSFILLAHHRVDKNSILLAAANDYDLTHFEMETSMNCQCAHFSWEASRISSNSCLNCHGGSCRLSINGSPSATPRAVLDLAQPLTCS
jgi:hypothetical protein